MNVAHERAALGTLVAQLRQRDADVSAHRPVAAKNCETVASTGKECNGQV